MPLTAKMPDSIRSITVGEKTVHLVGTAHVSRQSVEDVRMAADLLAPDCICVELCPSRYKAIKNPDAWKETNLFNIIREGKAFFLLAQLLMASLYRKIGDHLESPPGAEMLEGIRIAESRNIPLILADREVQITLKRVWVYLSFWQKIKLLYHIMLNTFEVEQVESAMIEEMKQWDQMESLLETFGRDLPGAKHRLIDERDTYLAEKIKSASGKNILAVVGAGHVPGICREILHARDIRPLEELPPPGILGRIFKWFIPLGILLLLIYGFLSGNPENSRASISIWILANGSLAALGTALAFGHPLAILSAFVAAPITSLNPMIAAGWVAGFVQAYVHKPTVADFERVPEDLATMKGIWRNRVSRILLVVLLANLGSMVGTVVAGTLIARLLL